MDDEQTEFTKRTMSISELSSPYNEKKLCDELGFNVSDISEVEKAIYSSVHDDDRTRLLKIFETHPSPPTLLQILLTTTYSNKEKNYQHEPDVLVEAQELLGSRYGFS